MLVLGIPGILWYRMHVLCRTVLCKLYLTVLSKLVHAQDLACILPRVHMVSEAEVAAKVIGQLAVHCHAASHTAAILLVMY